MTFTDTALQQCINETAAFFIHELTTLSCDGWAELDKITDTRGIEELTALEVLELPYHNFSQIDLSKNTALTHLNLANGPDLAETLDYRPDTIPASYISLQEGNLNATQESTIALLEDTSTEMRVNGSGFFVLESLGQHYFARSLDIGFDNDGYIISGSDARVQGFNTENGNEVSGIRIESHLPPRQTTRSEFTINFDAFYEPPYHTAKQLISTGNVIGIPQVGLKQSTTTTLNGEPFTLPIDILNRGLSFDITLSDSSGNNGTVTTLVDAAAGIPSQINNFNDLRTLAGVLNSQFFQPAPPQTQIDVIVTAIDDGAGIYHLEFETITAGEASEIRLTNHGAWTDEFGLTEEIFDSLSIPGIAEANNGYPMQSIDITDANGSDIRYTSAYAASASTTAAELNSLTGIEAYAENDIILPSAGYNNQAGNLVVNLNGVDLTGGSLADLRDEITSQAEHSLPGIEASLNPTTNDLHIHSLRGDDFHLTIDSVDDGDSLEVRSFLTHQQDDPTSQILEVDVNEDSTTPGAATASQNKIVVGGKLTVITERGYDLSNAQPPSTGLFPPLTIYAFEQVIINDFDPNNSNSYNVITSQTIYDSLGIAHELLLYAVKQAFFNDDTLTTPNHWVIYVQIDDQHVGDPDTNLAPPENTWPSQAAYNIYFNEDGSFNALASDDILISNWIPSDAEGNPNGATGPLNALAGGGTNIPDPPNSSNFVIYLEGSTQYGSPFSVVRQQQNGYESARLSDLNIEQNGIVVTSYTNGISENIAQFALAEFPNNSALQAIDDNLWAMNARSGSPKIHRPGLQDEGVYLTSSDIPQGITSDRGLTEINLSSNRSLTYLDLSGNKLITVDIEKNTLLEHVDLNSNQLSRLDLSENVALRDLNLWQNQITQLDLSQNTALTFLDLWDNRLTTIDLSHNPNLESLYLNANRLSCDEIENVKLQFPELVLDEPNCAYEQIEN